MLTTKWWRRGTAAAALALGAMTSTGASAAVTLYNDPATFLPAVQNAAIGLGTESFDGAEVNLLPAVQLPGFQMAISGPESAEEPGLFPYLVSNNDPDFCFVTCITAGFISAGSQLDFTFSGPVHAVSLLIGASTIHEFKVLLDGVEIGVYATTVVNPDALPHFDFLGVFDPDDPSHSFTTLSLRSDEPAGDTEIENLSFDRSAQVPEPSSLSLLLAGLGLVGWRARRRRGQG